MLDNTLHTNGTLFRRLEPKKPAVTRVGDNVRECFFYNGMKECLGVRCYWPRVGKCPIFDRIVAKAGAIKPSSKRNDKISNNKNYKKLQKKVKTKVIKIKLKRKSNINCRTKQKFQKGKGRKNKISAQAKEKQIRGK